MFLSIDPGLNFTGISVIDTSSGFNVVETLLVKNMRKFTEEEKIVEHSYGSRAVKIYSVLYSIYQLLDKYQISSIVIEAPFYNPRTPNAYGSLLEVIFAIKYSIIIPLKIPFKLIEPLLVKKLFSNMSQASKEVMKDFLIRKLEDKSITMSKPIEGLSEHEIDSIAIGFVHHITLVEESRDVVVSG